MRRDEIQDLEALARVARAKERLKRQSDPTPHKPRHTIIETDQHVGAGRDSKKERRTQALTLVELMYNAKHLTMNEVMAADWWRTRYLDRQGQSEGVGSYGDNPGGNNPSAKVDRVGRALTGLKVNWAKGKVTYRGEPYRTNNYDFEAATLAMCGVINIEGKQSIDEQLKRVMTSAICDTTDIMTQEAVGRLRTFYKAEKQSQAAGAVAVREALRRLVMFLRYGS